MPKKIGRDFSIMLIKMTILNTTQYDEWENNRNTKALEWAQELIDEFNNTEMYHKYTCNQTKSVLEYTLMKVWHILNSSGIFMVHNIKKKGTKCIVTISLS